MIDIGKLKAIIGADYSPLQKAQLAVSNITGNMERSLRRVTGGARDMTNIFRGLGGQLLAIAGIGGFAMLTKSIVKTGMEFEHSMAIVRGVTKATEYEFIKMREKALEMGKATEWTAKQSAEALTFLGMAGLTAAESIAALPPMLDLATAGNIDLGRAADVSTNALTAMQMEVKELGRVNDVFIRTITSTNTNMEMMAESFKYSAPLASALGYSIEELSGLIGLLGNAGIQGSMAGTQLAFAMQRTKEAFEYFGESAVDSEGNLKSLIDALRMMEEKGATATDVMEIFGQRGGRAILSLQSIGIEFVEYFIHYIEQMDDDAKRLADTMRQTTVGAFKELQSALQNVQIELFNQRSGELNRALRDMADWVRENTDAIIDFGDSALLAIYDAAAAWDNFKAQADAAISVTLGKLAELIRVVGDARVAIGGLAQNAASSLQEKVSFLSKLTPGTGVASSVIELMFPKSKIPKVSDKEMANKPNPFQGWIDKFNEMKGSSDTVLSQHESEYAASKKKAEDRRAQIAHDKEVRGIYKAHPREPRPWSEVDIKGVMKAVSEQAKLENMRNAAGGAPPPGRDGGGGGGGSSDLEKELKEKLKVQEKFEEDYLEITRGRHARERLSLDKQKKEYDKYVDDKLSLEEWYQAEVFKLEQAAAEERERSAQQALEKSKEWKDGAIRAIKEYHEKAIDTASGVERVFSNAFNNMENAFTTFLSTGELSFSNFVDSLIADLARLAVQKFITGPLSGAMGSIFGGGGGSAIMPGSADAKLFGEMHKGGRVGMGSIPRLHSGLRPGEFPAILERGEEVIPKNSPKRPSSAVNIYVYNYGQSQVSVDQKESPGGGMDISVMIDDAVAGKIRGKSSTYRAIKDTFGLKPIN